jgi:hypothetical protein
VVGFLSTEPNIILAEPFLVGQVSGLCEDQADDRDVVQPVLAQHAIDSIITDLRSVSQALSAELITRLLLSGADNRKE